LLATEPELDATVELHLRDIRTDRTDDRLCVRFDLEVAGDVEDRIGAERGRRGLEPYQGGEGHVVEGLQPVLLSCLAGELDQLFPLGIGDPVQLQHVPHVAGSRADLRCFDAGDL
jgi:hypothetical protein